MTSTDERQDCNEEEADLDELLYNNYFVLIISGALAIIVLDPDTEASSLIIILLSVAGVIQASLMLVVERVADMKLRSYTFGAGWIVVYVAHQCWSLTSSSLNSVLIFALSTLVALSVGKRILRRLKKDPPRPGGSGEHGN